MTSARTLLSAITVSVTPALVDCAKAKSPVSLPSEPIVMLRLVTSTARWPVAVLTVTLTAPVVFSRPGTTMAAWALIVPLTPAAATVRSAAPPVTVTKPPSASEAPVTESRTLPSAAWENHSESTCRVTPAIAMSVFSTPTLSLGSPTGLKIAVSVLVTVTPGTPSSRAPLTLPATPAAVEVRWASPPVSFTRPPPRESSALVRSTVRVVGVLAMLRSPDRVWPRIARLIPVPVTA